jgi:peptidoglycan/LPS O-acetylase OafA/YrhL
MNWLEKKFELSRGGSLKNSSPMEGLRGFAVSLIFIVHYVTHVGPWLSKESSIFAFSKKLQSVGHAGVDLFFVLSGYLIYRSLISRHQTFFQFMSRRIRRIYPTFTVIFIGYILLSFAFPSKNKIPGTVVEGMIYLVQNFLLLPGLFPIMPMINVAWSLSYEMLYYLIIPFIILIFRLRDRSAIWRVTFFLCLSALITLFSILIGGSARIIMFITGIMIYEAMGSDPASTPQSTTGLLALVVGLLALVPYNNRPIVYVTQIYTLFIAFFILCLVCFQSPTAWLPRFFSLTPLRWLGNMSYSYYLLHGLVLNLLFLGLSSIVTPTTIYGHWLFWIFLPPMFCLTLIPTAILFLLVERPFSFALPNQKGNEPND